MSQNRGERRVVVTGASRGLGLEFVREYVEAGDRVYALARDPEASAELQAIAKSAGDRLRTHACDVADDASVNAARDAVARDFDGVDVLLNNAGIQGVYGASLEDLDWQELRDVFEVNTLGPLRVTRAFLPLLRRGVEPRAVQLSTMMGSIADNSSGGAYSYRLSKAALNMANRNLGHALGKSGIICVAVHPGWVKTDMGGPRAPIETPDSVGAMIATIDRLKPEDGGSFVDRNGKVLPY